MEIDENTKALNHFENIEKEIDKQIFTKSDFVPFILISIGIELIGAFTDGKGFSEANNSEVRFTNGLDFFENTWYHNNKSWIYKNLRGALVHQFRPGDEIYLSSVFKNKEKIENHLTKKDDRIIFVLEQFYTDYKTAVQTLKLKFTMPNSFNKEKPEENFIFKNKDGDTGGTKTIVSKSAEKPKLTRQEKRKLEKERKQRNKDKKNNA